MEPLSSSGKGSPSPLPPLAVAPFSPEVAEQHQQAWAKHFGVAVVEKNSIGMQMTLIPPGEFVMGSPDADLDAHDNEKPQHEVRITQPFHLASHQVTVGQFRAFVEATDYKTSQQERRQAAFGLVEVDDKVKWQCLRRFNWQNVGFEQIERHPVVNVTWDDAVAFCEWLSKKEQKTYRLPTEAEWEFACRSGTTTCWYFGDNDAELCKYAWDGNVDRPQPVGQKLPNGFEIFDMCGNVWEWCSDWYSPDYYRSSPVDDPEGPSAGVVRVLRGGSFCHFINDMSSAYRNHEPSSSWSLDVGFRPARDLP
jgi:formylglycine-generating enzyme required for sulfatase activity